MVAKLVRALVVVLLWASPVFAVTLSWDPSPQADLAGYKVYWGTVSGTYTRSQDVGNVTTATIDPGELGTIYFALTTYDKSGKESGYSAEIIAQVTPPPPPQSCLKRERDAMAEAEKTPNCGPKCQERLVVEYLALGCKAE